MSRRTTSRRTTSRQGRKVELEGNGFEPRSTSYSKLAARVLINLLQSPTMLSILLGIAYNFIFPVTPGDTSSNKNIPFVIDNTLKLGGQPYSMAALFGGGMAVVGKLNKLRGKSLVTPLLLSCVKIVVAPFIAFYISRALYNGADNASKFSEYCFVYSSLPSSSLALIMAQAIRSPLSDMLSGATVLVMLLWTPIMLLLSGLIVNPNLGNSTSLDVWVTVLSSVGFMLLVLSGVLSRDWQLYPKYFIPILSCLGLLGNIFSERCLHSIQWPSNAHDHSYASADNVLYFFSKFFELWFRLSFTFGAVIETFLIHSKGGFKKKALPNMFSRWKMSILVSGLASFSVTLFAILGVEQTGGYYPCINQFGSIDAFIDIAILSVELMICVFFLYKLLFRPPGKFNNNEPRIIALTEVLLNPKMTQSVDPTHDRHHNSFSQHEEKKCGITGDFMFKLKLFLGFYILGQGVAILDGIQFLRPSVSKTDPVLSFVHLCFTVTVRGRGMFLFACFIFMRDNGWRTAFFKVRSLYRSIVYATDMDLLADMEKDWKTLSANMESRLGTTYVMKLKIILKRLVEEGCLFRDRKYRCITYEDCTSGSDLLDYLQQKGEIGGVDMKNRQQALTVAKNLFDLGLIHHVKYEHIFKDSGYFYTYDFPDDEFFLD